MVNQKNTACGSSILRPWLVLVGLFILAGPMANIAVQAHGGKTHGEADFAALQALQKATELYDRLIVSGKLDESWETGLAKVEVLSRLSQDAMEYRVGFHRRSGDPEAVYIFLSSEGKYTGSNFDGNW